MKTPAYFVSVSIFIAISSAFIGCSSKPSPQTSEVERDEPLLISAVPPQRDTEPVIGDEHLENCRRWKERLVSLHHPMPEPQPNDWLTNHRESGQLFEHYLQKENEPRIDGFNRILIVPIGAASPAQAQIVQRTADYLSANFGLPVEMLDPVAIEDFPDEVHRDELLGFGEQLLTTHILNEVLPPRRPKDALAVLGMTTYDLWPGKGWNFVFGQASLANRVGVWSLARYGDPSVDETTYRLALERTVKVALHETGHMVGIPHCTAFACCMNGSNHLAETDRQPLEFCPECQAKIWWTCRYDPQKRLHRLAELAREDGLHPTAGFFEAEAEQLQDPVPSK